MTEERSLNSENIDKAIKGIVTARKCEHCGHHEIGIITDEGEYLPLRPGMTIEIVNWSEAEEEVKSRMKFDWEEHLEKLVQEWVESGQPLRNALEPLCGEGRYLVSDDMKPRLVVQYILSDLSAIGERRNLQKYLERSQEARELPLESLLSEYHPSSLD